MPAALPPAKPILKPAPAAAAIGATAKKTFSSSAPQRRSAHKITLYGPEGLGKTTLSCQGPGPLKVIDLDNSLGALNLAIPGVSVVGGVEDWQDLRDCLHQEDLWKDTRSIVIDTLTRAQEMCLHHTLATVKKENGEACQRIEDYGFGKGWIHLYGIFLNLFADFDAHIRAGRNVIIVCHDIGATIKNPSGEDYMKTMPRLQHSDKVSIRSKLIEWTDHLLFLRPDIAVNKNKVRGSGSRMIYTAGEADFAAKSRSLSEPITFSDPSDTSLWKALFSEIPF